jgi:hypothetical protein
VTAPDAIAVGPGPIAGTVIIARGGTAAQARSILQQAGLLPDQHANVPPPGVTDANP